jgi:hypothetical protein
MSDNVIPFPQPPPIEIGGPVSYARATLCIYGDDLDPDEITTQLRMAPERSHRRGDRRPDGPAYAQGAWLSEAESEEEPDAPDLALGRLLDRLPTDPGLWARLNRDYEVRIFFRIDLEGWNKGFTLESATLQRLAAIGVRLDFDLYVSDNMPPGLDELLGTDRG